MSRRPDAVVRRYLNIFYGFRVLLTKKKRVKGGEAVDDHAKI